VDVLGAGTDVTTIDGNSLGSVVVGNGVDNATKLDGFTITNGSGTQEQNDVRGGGIYLYESHPTISNCAIVANVVSNAGSTTSTSIEAFGGGMCNYYSDPKIINCIFTSNIGVHGGAVYNYYHHRSLRGAVLNLIRPMIVVGAQGYGTVPWHHRRL
ncbi:hypothetical protein ACFL43_06365, partial [Thermodesulfobacteriota bacterium]